MWNTWTHSARASLRPVRMDGSVRTRSAAQALLWFALAVPLFVSIAGLAIDGGMLLTARRQVQSVADGAARAGATRLDLMRLRDSGGADVQLDTARAIETATSYLNERLPIELTWQAAPQLQVESSVRRVHVVVRGTLRTAFLRVIHIDNVPVEASAFADVRYGIHSGGGD